MRCIQEMSEFKRKKNEISLKLHKSHEKHTATEDRDGDLKLTSCTIAFS